MAKRKCISANGLTVHDAKPGISLPACWGNVPPPSSGKASSKQCVCCLLVRLRSLKMEDVTPKRW
jgi:hypothetical protein